MNRLIHSPQGYLRQMQMSANNLWIFVEGKTDRYFYSKLLEATGTKKHRDRAVIATAGELTPSNNGGGKQTILGFFDFLRRRRDLVNVLAGKETRAVFFVDKDIDDLLGGRRISPHLIYTEYYNVENYAFRYGDLVDAVAAALSVPRHEVRAIIPDARAWRIAKAQTWKDWARLCVSASLLRVRCAANFGANSSINVGEFGTVDQAALKAFETMIMSSSKLSAPDVSQVMKTCAMTTDRYFATNKHDRLFNGKWYSGFIEYDIHTAIPRAITQGLSKRVVNHLVQSMDFSAPWARNLRTRLAVHMT